ncbi:MAG TPA: sigma-70 family RNA polymerase sigma factor [Chitinophagaceae bacterium]|nr:sigma-70 family RNA polymerase sigma factor [Chitinophagaceae bacterium]
MSNPPGVNEDFLRLIQQNSGIIYKICYTYCTDRNDREDLAQEIIYQLWKSGKSYDATYKFTTWMYRVALNVAISFSRRRGKASSTISIDGNNIDVEDTAEHVHDREEKIALLQQYIQGLKELDRALMILYLDGKAYSEIAEVTGLTETNVATKISRIKEKMKQKFSGIKK